MVTTSLFVHHIYFQFPLSTSAVCRQEKTPQVNISAYFHIFTKFCHILLQFLIGKSCIIKIEESWWLHALAFLGNSEKVMKKKALCFSGMLIRYQNILKHSKWIFGENVLYEVKVWSTLTGLMAVVHNLLGLKCCCSESEVVSKCDCELGST